MREHIRHSNLIEEIDDPDADRQSMQAWLWLNWFESLNHMTVKELQRLITKTQDTLTYEQRGRYRTITVEADGQPCPVPGMVQHLMDNWLLDYRELDPITAHVRFEKIHPFVDGNGRTGRMLLWWMQKQQGQKPLLIRSDETSKQNYYAWFK